MKKGEIKEIMGSRTGICLHTFFFSPIELVDK